jgi:transposase
MLKIINCALDYNETCENTKSALSRDVFMKLYEGIINRKMSIRNRAVVLIAFYENIPINTISSALNICEKTVRNIINRYSGTELDILSVPIISAKKKSDTKEYADIIFSTLHSPPSEHGINRTTWRMTDLYQVINNQGYKIGLMNIRKIIRKAGYQFRKAKIVLTSNDPEYSTKLKELTNILSNLKINEKFFSIDEYGPFAIKMYNGIKLVPRGEVRMA